MAWRLCLFSSRIILCLLVVLLSIFLSLHGQGQLIGFRQLCTHIKPRFFNPALTSTHHQIVPSAFRVVDIKLPRVVCECNSEIYYDDSFNCCSPLLPPQSCPHAPCQSATLLQTTCPLLLNSTILNSLVPHLGPQTHWTLKLNRISCSVLNHVMLHLTCYNWVNIISPLFWHLWGVIRVWRLFEFEAIFCYSCLLKFSLF